MQCLFSRRVKQGSFKYFGRKGRSGAFRIDKMSNDGKQSDVVGSEGVEGPSEEIARFRIFFHILQLSTYQGVKSVCDLLKIQLSEFLLFVV